MQTPWRTLLTTVLWVLVSGAAVAQTPAPLAGADPRAAEAAGRAAFDAGRYAEARATWQGALVEARQRNDVALVASLLAEIGRSDNRLDDFAPAAASLEEALAKEHDLKDRPAEANVLLDLGIVYDSLGRYPDALLAHQSALTIFRERGDRLGEAKALSNIGSDDTDLGRYEDALRVESEALAAYRELENRLGEANVLDSMGLAQTNLSRYDDALRAEQSALAIHRELKNREGEARDLLNLGNVYADLSRYDDSLGAEQDALAIDRDLKNRLGEAKSLTNIGNIERSRGRYDQAYLSYQDALEIQLEIKYRLGQATNLGNIGAVVAEAVGQYATALRYEQAALAIDRDIKNRLGEARNLTNIGVFEEDLGRLADASSAYQESLAIDREIKNRVGEASDLASIGTIGARQGHTDDALRSFEDALAIEREIKNRFGEAKVRSLIGNLDEKLGHYDDALSFAAAAAEMEEDLGDASVWRSLSIEAVAEENLGVAHEQAAIGHFEEAIARIEQLRTGLGERHEREAFLGTTLFVYDEYVAFLCELDRRYPGKGYDRKALRVLELKEARAILEDIGESASHHFAGVPQSVVSAEDELANELADAREKYGKLRAAVPRDAAAVAAAQQRFDELTAQQERLLAADEAQYPAYFELRHPQPLDVATLPGILQPGELLLVYDLLPKHSALWAIDRDHVALMPLAGSETLGAGVAKLDAHVDGIIARLDSGAIGTRGELQAVETSDLPSFADDSYALYQQLIPPAVAQLIASKAVKSVVVVPSKSLYRLAFETLVSQAPKGAPSPHYLIEDAPVSYVPSASLLAVVRRSYTHHRSAGRDPLLAFANPAYGAAEAASPATRGPASYGELQYAAMRSVVRGATRSGASDSTFPPLPGTQAEADAVRAALDAPQRSLVVGDDATRANLLALNESKQLKRYQYLLFATHAVLPNEVQGVTQPAIVLAHPDPKKGDGFLTMADVFGLSLDADFVTLSACDTGVGQPNGDGISGLTRAFLYAGTPAISVTLWEVDDEAAPRLTPPFFGMMHAGKMTPAQALRAAKRAMIASPEPGFHHPYAWAPAVIFGDGDSLF